jgi:hypothetical protein
MSNSNKISVALSAEQITQINDAINTISSLMPFLVNLSKAERIRLRKLGPRNVDYVNRCLIGAQTFPNSLPGSLDVVEFERDVNLTNVLTGFSVKVQALLEGIEDTKMASGSDSMMTSDETYAALKRAGKKDASVKAFVDSIASLFKRGSSAKKATKGDNI